jgi:hypothetical protein
LEPPKFGSGRPEKLIVNAIQLHAPLREVLVKLPHEPTWTTKKKIAVRASYELLNDSYGDSPAGIIVGN